MSFQAYLDNIEQKTGKTPNEFITLAKEKGFTADTKSGEIVTCKDWVWTWSRARYGSSARDKEWRQDKRQARGFSRLSSWRK